jgi:hypothetical protein
MKSLQINFREPNIDRFIEIMAVAFNMNIAAFKFHISNMPKGYANFIYSVFQLYIISTKEDCDFLVEYPSKFQFDQLFNDRNESVETILDRINRVSKIENYEMNPGSYQLLKRATEKLNLNKDQVQSIINLSYVIACLDNAKQIGAEHTAEAIQYIREIIIPED